MCYLVAKKMFEHGCIVLRTRHGANLVRLKHEIRSVLGSESIQLVTISKPSAFGEYRPYDFALNEEDFKSKVFSKYR